MVLHSAVLCRACSSSVVPVAVDLLTTQGLIERLHRHKMQEPKDKPVRHLSKTSVTPFQNLIGSLNIVFLILIYSAFSRIPFQPEM
jgi:hypothetical protein